MHWVSIKRITTNLVFSLVACIFLVGAVEAATWRVERDGSGDFITIQPAVDASAPGDTILIGPGHYTEAMSVQPTGWEIPIDIFVYEVVGGLTFIGSGADEVFIGPNEYYSSPNLPFGFLMMDGGRIENITIHNVWNGVYCDWGGVETSSCVLDEIANVGLYVRSEGGLLVNQCQFSEADYALVTFPPCSSTEIRNSEFVNSLISLQSTPHVIIENCTFTGGDGGVQFDHSTGSVTGCEMSGQTSGCIVAIGGSHVTISNCHLISDGVANNGAGIIAWSEANVSASNCVVGGNFSAFYVRRNAVVNASSCNIEKIGPWYFNCNSYDGPSVDFDFTNNYWGTTDIAEISAGIWDRNDDDSLGPVINFEPIIEDPISATNSKSMGSFRAMFR